jgi:beta-glucosidase
MADPSYRDASSPVEKRVEDLLERMTLQEKVAQLGCVWSTALVDQDQFSPEKAAGLMAAGTGQVTRIGAATGLRPAENAAFMNAIQEWLMTETRLGIPALVHEESTAGFCARDADQFPQAIGLAATWDPDAVGEMAAVIREQMLAVGARQTLAPVLDVAREPRWGRVEETYGEDPYLCSRLGVAYVRGLQSDDLAHGVVATGKHFLGYGLSEGGHNHKPAHIGPRELREVFARPFLAAIQEAGLASVMNAYNEVDGLPCGGSAEILDDLLRGELGFRGVVVADYFTTMLLIASHRVADSKAAAAKMALEAGLDVELPATDCYAELVALVESGELDESVVDRSLRRVLHQKFELGLFERWGVDPDRAAIPYQTPDTRTLARELAARSLVLLKNAGDLLPLDPATSRIAVLGPCADDVRLLQGDYHYPAHTEIVYKRQGDDAGDILPRADAIAFQPGPYYPPTVTPLEGIRAVVSPETRILHARGCDVQAPESSGIADAVKAARNADVALVFVGGRSGLMPDCTVGEFRDASDLGLPGAQQRLLEEVVATGTPTVAIVVSGRVHALPWAAEHVQAMLYAWVPGQEGGSALADVLFGAVAPSGRLPVSLPHSAGQLPIYSGRHWPATGGAGPFSPDYSDGPGAPLYPFGHGLSTTTFDYADLELEAQRVAADQPLEIACRITNTGPQAADEVVQLYVQDPLASVVRPTNQLAGFARVALEPGQSRRVVFELDPSQLALYDRGMRFVVEPGKVLVRIGASSTDTRLQGEFEIVGETRALDPAQLVPTQVRVE